MISLINNIEYDTTSKYEILECKDYIQAHYIPLYESNTMQFMNNIIICHHADTQKSYNMENLNNQTLENIGEHFLNPIRHIIRIAVRKPGNQFFYFYIDVPSHLSFHYVEQALMYVIYGKMMKMQNRIMNMNRCFYIQNYVISVHPTNEMFSFIKEENTITFDHLICFLHHNIYNEFVMPILIIDTNLEYPTFETNLNRMMTWSYNVYGDIFDQVHPTTHYIIIKGLLRNKSTDLIPIIMSYLGFYNTPKLNNSSMTIYDPCMLVNGEVDFKSMDFLAKIDDEDNKLNSNDNDNENENPIYVDHMDIDIEESGDELTLEEEEEQKSIELQMFSHNNDYNRIVLDDDFINTMQNYDQFNMQRQNYNYNNNNNNMNNNNNNNVNDNININNVNQTDLDTKFNNKVDMSDTSVPLLDKFWKTTFDPSEKRDNTNLLNPTAFNQKPNKDLFDVLTKIGMNKNDSILSMSYKEHAYAETFETISNLITAIKTILILSDNPLATHPIIVFISKFISCFSNQLDKSIQKQQLCRREAQAIFVHLTTYYYTEKKKNDKFTFKSKLGNEGISSLNAHLENIQRKMEPYSFKNLTSILIQSVLPAFLDVKQTNISSFIRKPNLFQDLNGDFDLDGNYDLQGDYSKPNKYVTQLILSQFYFSTTVYDIEVNLIKDYYNVIVKDSMGDKVACCNIKENGVEKVLNDEFIIQNRVLSHIKASVYQDLAQIKEDENEEKVNNNKDDSEKEKKNDNNNDDKIKYFDLEKLLNTLDQLGKNQDIKEKVKEINQLDKDNCVEKEFPLFKWFKEQICIPSIIKNALGFFNNIVGLLSGKYSLNDLLATFTKEVLIFIGKIAGALSLIVAGVFMGKKFYDYKCNQSMEEEKENASSLERGDNIKELYHGVPTRIIEESKPLLANTAYHIIYADDIGEDIKKSIEKALDSKNCYVFSPKGKGSDVFFFKYENSFVFHFVKSGNQDKMVIRLNNKAALNKYLKKLVQGKVYLKHSVHCDLEWDNVMNASKFDDIPQDDDEEDYHGDKKRKNDANDAIMNRIEQEHGMMYGDSGVPYPTGEMVKQYMKDNNMQFESDLKYFSGPRYVDEDENKIKLQDTKTTGFGLEGTGSTSIVDFNCANTLPIFIEGKSKSVGYCNLIKDPDGDTKVHVLLHLVSEETAHIFVGKKKIFFNQKAFWKSEPQISITNLCESKLTEALVAFSLKGVTGGYSAEVCCWEPHSKNFDHLGILNYNKQLIIRTKHFSDFSYDIKTEKGDCGLPIFGFVQNKAYMIGFHTFSNKTNGWNSGLMFKGGRFVPLFGNNSFLEWFHTGKSVYSKRTLNVTYDEAAKGLLKSFIPISTGL